MSQPLAAPRLTHKTEIKIVTQNRIPKNAFTAICTVFIQAIAMTIVVNCVAEVQCL